MSVTNLINFLLKQWCHVDIKTADIWHIKYEKLSILRAFWLDVYSDLLYLIFYVIESNRITNTYLLFYIFCTSSEIMMHWFKLFYSTFNWEVESCFHFRHTVWYSSSIWSNITILQLFDGDDSICTVGVGYNLKQTILWIIANIIAITAFFY